MIGWICFPFAGVPPATARFGEAEGISLVGCCSSPGSAPLFAASVPQCDSLSFTNWLGAAERFAVEICG